MWVHRFAFDQVLRQVWEGKHELGEGALPVLGVAFDFDVRGIEDQLHEGEAEAFARHLAGGVA